MKAIPLLLLFFAVTWLNSKVVAATYTVTNTADVGAGSLRQALADARIQGGTNTIVFDPALSGQTITLASELVVDEWASAAHHLTIDATSLTGGLTISGNQANRIFFQNDSETSLTLRGLTLINGKATAAGGGAIESYGTLTLAECTLTGNSASWAGAIYYRGGTLTMTHCTLSANQALHSSGGAVSLDSDTTAIFTECTFAENLTSASVADGGAIDVDYGSVLTLTKCFFTSNSSRRRGGAVSIYGTSATLTDCTFSENIAATSGGAILNRVSTVSLVRCTLGFNTATDGSGGAILNANDSQTPMAQCTITGNMAGASGNGGAISNLSDSSVAITQCTISGNTAGSGGGGGIWNDVSGSVTVTNSIVAGNTSSGGADIRNEGGVFGRAGANFVGNPESATAIFPSGMPNASGDFVGTSEVPLNPQLGPLADNGGPTRTMALLPGSLARDRGVALDPPSTGDQRGRPILYKPDIGAFETQFGVVHRPLLIPSDSPAGNVLCTLETEGTVSVTSSNQAIIPNDNITITGTGLSRTITITPIAGQVGNSTIVLTHQPSGETDTFQVYALSPDYVPVSIGGISDRTINEDASTLSVPFTVTDPAGAGLTVRVESSNLTLVPKRDVVAAGDGPSRTLAITPAPNENGSTQITVTTTDGLTTASRSFLLTVDPVNDAPSFIKGEDQFTETSTGSQRDGWGATALSKGPANEAPQTLTFLVTNDNNALFSVQPAISANGYLTYTPVIGAEGIATVSVQLRDNGGTANGGMDTSPLQTFTIRLVTSTTPTVVTSLADRGPGSLREMVSIARAKTGADVVTFLPELSGQVITLASQITVADWFGVTIDAAALPGGLAISGNNQTRVFRNSDSLALIGLTINGGDAYEGGAIYNDGICILTGCTLSGNSVTSRGGAIYNYDGKIILTRCTLSGNSTADDGGAIHIYRGTLTLSQCTLLGNSAASDGGALYNDSGSNLILTQCALSGNSAAFDGGALYNRSASDLILTQCTLSGNSATRNGGAIYHSTGSTKLTHCTLAGNSANNGGAIYHLGSFLLNNCIVATNSASIGADIYRSGLPALTRWGVNVIGKNSSVSTAFPAGLPNAQGNYVGTNSNPLNPQLAPLGNYGGPTRTMALLPNSVARNRAGAVTPAITEDQRGFPIVGTPDVGAYESGTTNTFPVWSFETLGSAPSFANDNDRDGHADGLEYATRTNPAAGNTSPLTTPTRNAAGAMEIRFPYRPGVTDVRYVVLRSPDLRTWTEIYRYDTKTGVIEELGITADENAATEIITITDPVDTAQSFWTLRTELLP